MNDLAAAYAFTGDEARIVRKTKALRKKFGEHAAVRLGAVSGQEAVDYARQPAFDPERLLVVDGRGWKKEDVEPVLLYLLDPTPGTTLALWLKTVPKPLASAVGETFKLAAEEKPNLLWPMVDAWGANRRALVLTLLAEQLAQGDSPFMLHAVLTSQVRLVLRVKGYAAQGLRAGEVARLTGKTEWALRKAHQQGRRRTLPQLAGYLQILAEADDRMKGGARTPVEFELVQAVAKLF